MIKTMSKLDDLLKLLDLKKEKNELAKTEMLFFEDERTLQKKYLKPFYDKSSSMK